LYEFEVLNTSKTIKMLWTTSCSSASGSETADTSTLQELFIDQLPGAEKKIGSLWR
jgi:hypothetical protein